MVPKFQDMVMCQDYMLHLLHQESGVDALGGSRTGRCRVSALGGDTCTGHCSGRRQGQYNHLTPRYSIFVVTKVVFGLENNGSVTVLFRLFTLQ